MSDITDENINIAFPWIYTIANLNGTRDATRKVLREAQQFAIDSTRPYPDDEITGDDEISVTVLTRCLEIWDQRDREAIEDEWEEETQKPIAAVIVTKGARGKDGSILWWIRAVGEHAIRLSELGPQGARVPIQVEVGAQRYTAFFRYVESNQYAQIYPFVKDQDGGERAIGRILSDAGIKADQPISLIRVRNTIRVLQGK